MFLTTLPTLDQMTDVIDIKPILKMSLMGFWVSALVLLLLILFLILKFLRRNKVAEVKPVVVQRTLSPREQALKDLEDLEAMQWVERGQFRKHYFRVSEILRSFLQDEIRLPAVDTTTEEIRPHLKKTKYLSESEIQQVDAMLVEMDLVKFAKFVPSPEQIKNLMRGLKEFIRTAPASSQMISQGEVRA
ncbi:MAG: hypothetical protein JNK65_08430 [Deltaproteobacteria bacterium]|nr:hypothetical protein [Deltaproteobacteria bacterium]